MDEVNICHFVATQHPAPFLTSLQLPFGEFSPPLYRPDGNINLSTCSPTMETKGVPRRLLREDFCTIPGTGWLAQNPGLVNKTQSLGTWFTKQSLCTYQRCD